MISKLVLRAADRAKEFEIFADAANRNSISGVFIQREHSEDNSGYAVCFCSRKLTDAEVTQKTQKCNGKFLAVTLTLPTIEVELLDILYTLEKLRYYMVAKLSYGTITVRWLT